MSQTSSSPISALLITGLLAILGTVIGGAIQGYWETTLADKKFQADLVMKALEADDAAARADSLHFMIETNLIADPAIRQGLDDYLSDKARAVPRIRPTPLAYAPGVVVPSTAETAGYTDFTVFVCDAALDSDTAKHAAETVTNALMQTGRFGRIDRKAWRLYDEIPLQRLRDKLTLVVDADAGEAAELPRLKRILRSADLPPLQVIDNPGKPTPWLISLILCPSN
jgi:hypothetical protein